MDSGEEIITYHEFEAAGEEMAMPYFNVPMLALILRYKEKL
jgi:hypothetical protein